MARKILLKSVKILDQNVQTAQGGSIEPALVLVRLESLWQAKYEEAEHAEWLESISKSELDVTDSSMVARKHRLARWELLAAQHYAARDGFLSTKPTEASGDNPRIFQLARHTTSSPGASPTSTPSESNASQQLESNVANAIEAAKQAELAWKQQSEQASGLLEVVAVPTILPRPEKFPSRIFSSVFVVVVASAACAVWFQRLGYLGGAHDPLSVARQLEQWGIPTMATLALPHGPGESQWLVGVRQTVNAALLAASRNITRVSEWVVGLWVVLILARMMVDPLWRSVLIESPLAAFARVVVGLP